MESHGQLEWGHFTMRDFQLPRRSAVLAPNGMAATSHPRATLAAIDVLRAGGNAVDAAVTAAACLTVVEPHMTSAGGDLFALVSEPDGTIHGLNASGHAPKGLDAEWLRERGLSEMPEHHGLAVTVPGAVAGWAELCVRFGRFGLDRALQPAIDLARNGYPVAPRVAHDWGEAADRLRRDVGASTHHLKADGTAPKIGDVWVQPALAATYERIAAEGPDGFYRGAVAEDLVSAIARQGGVMMADDLADISIDWVMPVEHTYRAYGVVELPPNTQGVVALMMLGILEGFDLAELDPNGAQRVHLEMEAARLAYGVRDGFVGDPASSPDPADFLSPAHIASLRGRIDPARRGPETAAMDPRLATDTILLTVADGEGRCITVINSIFDSFGSGIVGEQSGVVLQNRGAAFSLQQGHPNEVKPGKRPLHTLIPGLLRRNGRTVMSFGVMGGQYQACGHTHFLTNMIDFGMDVQSALDAPRAFIEGGPLAVEHTVPETTQAQLSAMGHRVEIASKPWGGGQAIWIDHDRGVLIGGSDPRKDGCAIGF
ncbi:MAG: gamma-glutamyltransferase family protein [Pseudomonadota bacterium]